MSAAAHPPCRGCANPRCYGVCMRCVVVLVSESGDCEHGMSVIVVWEASHYVHLKCVHISDVKQFWLFKSIQQLSKQLVVIVQGQLQCMHACMPGCRVCMLHMLRAAS